MGYLNYEFFDEFKALDNLCRDIYGESIDNKLGDGTPTISNHEQIGLTAEHIINTMQ